MIKNRVYDILKWISVIVIPAIVVLINTLGQVWNWEYTKEISMTISAIGVFIGALIQISSAKYKKSQNNKNEEEEKQED